MRSQKIAAVLVMIFAGVFFAATFHIKEHSFVSGLTARFWPMAILALLFALAMLLYCQAARSREEEPIWHWRQAFFCCLFFLAYVLGLELVGYLFATLLFQIAFLRYMGIRGLWGGLALPCLITVMLMAAFIGLLGVMLPYGLGPVRTLNIALWG